MWQRPHVLLRPILMSVTLPASVASDLSSMAPGLTFPTHVVSRPLGPRMGPFVRQAQCHSRTLEKSVSYEARPCSRIFYIGKNCLSGAAPLGQRRDPRHSLELFEQHRGPAIDVVIADLRLHPAHA